VDKAAADPVKGTNVAYTLHFYAASHKQGLRDRAKAAMEKGAALMVTEWGTSEASGNGRLDAEETKRWLDFMDEHHLSWCNWSVIDKRETSAALVPKAAANGGWAADALSPSGKLVRDEIRARNAPPPTTPPR
jgi:endoglucanase